MTMYDILFRLLAALFLGGLIGYERQARSKAAGLRTHILVSMGACLFMLVSIAIPLEMKANFGLSSDGGRIAAQVVSGIGFLGAGSILAGQGARRIKGLTTAASIWAVAAVGLAAGAGFFFMAAVTTAFIFVTLTTLRLIDLHLEKHHPVHLSKLRITIDTDHVSAGSLRSFLIKKSVCIRSFETKHLSERQEELTLLIDEEENEDPLIAGLLLRPGVESASIQKHSDRPSGK